MSNFSVFVNVMTINIQERGRYNLNFFGVLSFIDDRLSSAGIALSFIWDVANCWWAKIFSSHCDTA